MALDFNSIVLFFSALALCGYYSYREGHKQGLKDGCEHALDNLMDDKIIHIDDRGEIQQWDKYYDKGDKEDRND